MLSLMNNLDLKGFRYINTHVKQSIFMDYLMIFFAEYAQYIFIILFIVLWLIKNFQGRVYVIQAVIACFFAFSLNRIIEIFFYRERPFVSHLEIHQLVEHTANASFPSNHATSSFAIAVTIFLYNKRVGALFLVLAFLISFSRVWIGVHYPLDVLIGAVLGILISLITQYIFKTKFVKSFCRRNLKPFKVKETK
ncbi:TPA: undecaprenyl-diphosphatase [Bacillus thuringiensis]|nr:undecaprenyl-diphosphatase [Bacillus thuringiensis]